MKRSLLKSALLAASVGSGVAGCAQYGAYPTGYPSGYEAPESSRPVVTIEETGTVVPSISVSPRVLSFPPGQGPVDIVWSIRNPTGVGARQFRFVDKGGIEIRGEIKYQVMQVDGMREAKAAAAGNVADSTYLEPKQDQIRDCTVLENGMKFTCKNVHKRPGLFKYAIRVQVIDGSATFLVDPPLENW